ncbi:MAG: hypothetical protein B7Y02_19245, partial [Rhodobacterales bacterium 17-64-5]
MASASARGDGRLRGGAFGGVQAGVGLLCGGGLFQGAGEREPLGAACAHIGQREAAVLLRQAVHQIHQAVEPAAGDGFSLGIADSPGEDN